MEPSKVKKLPAPSDALASVQQQQEPNPSQGLANLSQSLMDPSLTPAVSIPTHQTSASTATALAAVPGPVEVIPPVQPTGAAVSTGVAVLPPQGSAPLPPVKMVTRPKRASAAALASAEGPTSRRHSKRSVKRRKFDDELVESSLTKSTARPRTVTETSDFSNTAASSVDLLSSVSNAAQVSGRGQKAGHTQGLALSSSLGTGADLLTGRGAVPEMVLTASAGSGSGLSVSAPSTTGPAPGDKKKGSKARSKAGARMSPGVKNTAALKASGSGASLSSLAGSSAPGPPTAAAGAGGKAAGGRGAGKSTKSKKGVKAAAAAALAAAAAAATPSVKAAAQPVAARVSSAEVASGMKDLGLWRPQDDLLLIQSVQQASDLDLVHAGVKFSAPFTLQQIQDRWYTLLYKPAISKLSMSAIQKLPADIIRGIEAKALFSAEEETLLKAMPSNTPMSSLDLFRDLLDANPETFCIGRTPKSLRSHWQLLKQYSLLADQKISGDDHMSIFSDTEEALAAAAAAAADCSPGDKGGPSDYAVSLAHELGMSDRRQKRDIRQLEQDIPKWQVLVDNVVGINPPEFDSQTLAVLRGRLVRYLMRSREITLGRSTKDVKMDVDLSLEGPAAKVSRRQGLIKLKTSGEFILSNEGKRPIFVDGKPVPSKSKQRLNNNAVVEISCLKFVFLINHNLISSLRNETVK